MLPCGRHLDPLAAFDEHAVAVLARQNHVEIPAHLVSERLGHGLRLRDAAAIGIDRVDAVELPSRACIEHEVDARIETAFGHDGNTGLSCCRSQIRNRIHVIRRDQRRTLLDRCEHGISHQRHRQEIDDGVDVLHDVCKRRAEWTLGSDEPDFAEVAETREPGRPVGQGVDADHLLDTAACGAIGDRRTALQAKAS